MIGFADHVLLDLIELVDAEDATCVFAIGARLFAEAGAIADEGQRQIFVPENFILIHAGDRDFGGADQKGVFILDSVDLVASLGKLAAADKAELACHRRYGQGREAFADDAVHGKVH